MNDDIQLKNDEFEEELKEEELQEIEEHMGKNEGEFNQTDDLDEIQKTIRAEYNNIIGKSKKHDDLYSSLFLEIFDQEKSLYSIQQQIEGILISRGIQANTKTLFKIIELTHDRLIRAYVVKHLCNGLGLQDEYDRILNRELDLIYYVPKAEK